MGDGLLVTTSAASVAESVDALLVSLDARGITVFAVIDHAAGARESGLDLADEIVIVFGSPATGTGLMQDDPRAGIDLPLRMLIWDDHGTTRVCYRDPRALLDHFTISAHARTLTAMAALQAQLAAELA